MLKQQIAANLETTFGQFGFAESSVAQLQKASGVSLRTLYKYYPSKEDMIVAALESRHQRYLKILEADISELGFPAIQHIFSRLQHWMQHSAPKAVCLCRHLLLFLTANKSLM
ncbi:TetR/AcrR family transcriptional regulator [Shewanella halifaxensis]|uniref:TetR/AcrR family transcriptional regulator n=1 Tax=Shewanella halifaxensis TaxID=271098 RepID=UPI00352AA48F